MPLLCHSFSDDMPLATSYGSLSVTFTIGPPMYFFRRRVTLCVRVNGLSESNIAINTPQTRQARRIGATKIRCDTLDSVLGDYLFYNHSLGPRVVNQQILTGKIFFPVMHLSGIHFVADLWLVFGFSDGRHNVRQHNIFYTCTHLVKPLLS